MKNMLKITVATLSAAAAVMTSGATFAASRNPNVNTENLQFAEVLRIRLPHGLCEFQGRIPEYVVEQLRTRHDWDKLVAYMIGECPELGLPLADTATASITEPTDEDGSGGGSGGTGSDGSGSDGSDGSGGSGSEGSGSDGSGTDGSVSDDDGDNGHGNDTDGYDESNPGKKTP